MINKNIYIVFLILGFVILSSCATIKLPHGIYKNIGEKYDFEVIDTGNCDINIYRYKFLKDKMLNGKYCIEKSIGLLCAEFSNGILNGSYFVYRWDSDDKKNILIEEGNYHNGLLEGINYKYFKSYSSEMQVTYKKAYKSGYVNGYFEIYEDNQLIRKTHYKNSIKDGYEYLFSKEGDTLDVIHYTYDPNYSSFQKISEIDVYGNPEGEEIIKDFNLSNEYIGGKFTVVSKNDFYYISNSFSYTPLSLLEFNCNLLIPFKKRQYFYLTIVDNGYSFYDLYLIYPYSVMNLGRILKDDLH